LAVTRGIYTLVLRLDCDCDLSVGALGQFHLFAGCYAYTGSARGPGGLKRVQRHREINLGSKKTRRWHIDYLLPEATWVDVSITVTDLNLECAIAHEIGRSLTAVPGFGCSDCRCLSHLHYSSDCSKALLAVRSAHGKDYSSE
jgi:endonuclease-3